MLDKVENALGNFWVSGDRAHGRYLKSLQRPASWARNNQYNTARCCKSRTSRDKDQRKQRCHSSHGPSSVAKVATTPKGFEGAKLRTYQAYHFTRSKSARPAGDEDSALFSAFLNATCHQLTSNCPVAN